MVMTDNTWRTVSDPEAEGVPAHADDDSTAYDESLSPREADGPQPFSLPADRESGPLALDEHGVTALEERTGESLDMRLAREEPEVGDALPREQETELIDQEPVDPHLESAVSMYDREPTPGAEVTRLVAPQEAGSVAYDAGVAGGGPSAEEAAMHVVDEQAEADRQS